MPAGTFTVTAIAMPLTVIAVIADAILLCFTAILTADTLTVLL
jgi:hypothetical protein